MAKLTSAQDHFARLVVEGKTQAEAYRIAYPRSLKWSDASVWQVASRTMANVKVSSRVDALRRQLAARSILTAEKVLAEIGKIAFSDVRKIFGPSGELVRISDLSDEAASCIAGCDLVTVSKGEGIVEYVAKIKLADKLKALELAGKHLGLFRDNGQDDDAPLPVKVEITVIDGRRDCLPES